MFYSQHDIDFYEREIDITAQLEQARAEEARRQTQAAEDVQPAADPAPEPPVRRRIRPMRRLLATAAAAVLLSTGSIAAYDRLYVQPRFDALLAAGPQVQQVEFKPVSYGAQLTVPEIIDKALPSVVAVRVQGPWSTGTGSGVIMREDGTILTNQHVIAGAQSITVRTYDGVEHAARLIGADEKTDLAVLKIEAAGLKAATFGDSDRLVQGELAVAIGNPLDLSLEGSATQGIISGTSRQIEVYGRTMTYIQTDAAINPGNSGGALVNGRGEVIGINSVKVSSGDVEGLGFAIPVNIALPVAEELISHGYVSGRPSIGISVENRLYVPFSGAGQGVSVAQVTPGSGAEQAGIQPGDLIVALNGVETLSFDALNNEKDKYKPGDTVTLTLYRGTEQHQVDVVLGEMVG
ncbi:MAG: PDZ domain-containing protein [Clostridiales bacterium]|nr:PDZ domain-containing protein [Clostridiales bacterium]